MENIQFDWMGGNLVGFDGYQTNAKPSVVEMSYRLGNDVVSFRLEPLLGDGINKFDNLYTFGDAIHYSIYLCVGKQYDDTLKEDPLPAIVGPFGVVSIDSNTDYGTLVQLIHSRCVYVEKLSDIRLQSLGITRELIQAAYRKFCHQGDQLSELLDQSYENIWDDPNESIGYMKTGKYRIEYYSVHAAKECINVIIDKDTDDVTDFYDIHIYRKVQEEYSFDECKIAKQYHFPTNTDPKVALVDIEKDITGLPILTDVGTKITWYNVLELAEDHLA